MLAIAKKTLVVTLAVFAAIASAHAAGPTFDDAKALAEKAAALITAEGDKAFPKLADPNGGYHQGAMYVTVLDREGVVHVSWNQKLIGINMWEVTDPDGVKPSQEAWKVTEGSGTGILHYKFTNPETKKIEPREAWVRRVGDYVVFASISVGH